MHHPPSPVGSVGSRVGQRAGVHAFLTPERKMPELIRAESSSHGLSPVLVTPPTSQSAIPSTSNVRSHRDSESAPSSPCDEHSGQRKRARLEDPLVICQVDQRTSSSATPTAIPEISSQLAQLFQRIQEQADSQTKAIEAHQKQLEAFAASSGKRFDKLADRLRGLKEDEERDRLEIEHAIEVKFGLASTEVNSERSISMKGKGRDFTSGQLNALMRDNEHIISGYGAGREVCHVADGQLQTAVSLAISREDTPMSEYFTPLVAYSDLPAEILEFPSPDLGSPLMQMGCATSTPPRLENDVDGAETNGATTLFGSLVQRAVEAEKERLGDQPVLQEGESAVHFTTRKKLGRFEHDLGQDWSFLGWPHDHFSSCARPGSAAFSIPSRLSSGIEAPPKSDAEGDTWLQPRSDILMSRDNIPMRSLPSLEFTEMVREASTATTTASVRMRRSRRGGSLIEDKLLAPSDGKPGTGVKWPKYSKNTIKARMSEIECDTCGGRVHFVCAGLPDAKEMRNEPWSCPECLAVLETHGSAEEEGREVSPIPQAQRERCLRPKCVYRSHAKIVRKHKDDDEFFLQRIIGRERLGRNLKGQYTYKYLVKWFDWDTYDSTWEPAHNIPDIEREEQLFLHEAVKADLDVHWRYVLLPETTMWFDEKGKYKVELLKQLGVEDRSWWFES